MLVEATTVCLEPLNQGPYSCLGGCEVSPGPQFVFGAAWLSVDIPNQGPAAWIVDLRRLARAWGFRVWGF